MNIPLSLIEVNAACRAELAFLFKVMTPRVIEAFLCQNLGPITAKEYCDAVVDLLAKHEEIVQKLEERTK